jgi:hypothetical protein
MQLICEMSIGGKAASLLLPVASDKADAQRRPTYRRGRDQYAFELIAMCPEVPGGTVKHAFGSTTTTRGQLGEPSWAA